MRRDLALEELPRERVLAAAFRTLDLGAIRIGSEESLAGFRSRGLTTLLVRNAALDPPETVRFRFRAKGGIAQDVRVSDAALATFVEHNAERSGCGAALRVARGPADARRVGASDVNDDIRARTGGDFTAKDFRTLRGTIAAADHLARLGAEATARARGAGHPGRDRARELGARQHPHHRQGELRRPASARPRTSTTGSSSLRGTRETALLALLVDDA